MSEMRDPGLRMGTTCSSRAPCWRRYLNLRSPGRSLLQRHARSNVCYLPGPVMQSLAVQRNLVLIAGYPKSGSTWLRFIFETLRQGPGRTLSLNEMGSGYYGAWRRILFDDMAPVNAGELLPAEIDNALPDVFRALSGQTEDRILIKVHDAAGRTLSGGWLYPPDRVHAVIYLVRHPFDIAVSYAHHLGTTPDQAVALMGVDSIIGETVDRLRLPIHEHVGSWSSNVESWLGDTPYGVTLARYEDMLADPLGEFRRLASAAGFPDAEDKIVRAIEAGDFDRLSRQETESGFFERPRSSPRFFRAGRARSWEGLIDETSRSRLVREHGMVMTRLGYGSEGDVLPLQGLPTGPAIA